MRGGHSRRPSADRAPLCPLQRLHPVPRGKSKPMRFLSIGAFSSKKDVKERRPLRKSRGLIWKKKEEERLKKWRAMGPGWIIPVARAGSSPENGLPFHDTLKFRPALSSLFARVSRKSRAKVDHLRRCTSRIFSIEASFIFLLSFSLLKRNLRFAVAQGDSRKIFNGGHILTFLIAANHFQLDEN